MSASWYLFALMLGFALGIAAFSIFGGSTLHAALLCLIALSVAALSLIQRERFRGVLVALLIGGAALGALRIDLSERRLASLAPPGNIGQEVVLEGVVVAEPDRRESNQRIMIEVAGTRVLVIAEPYPNIFYGDRIKAEGRLEVPENFEGDTGRVFNYEAYLKKDGIQFVLRYATLERLGEGEGNPLMAGLLTLKSRFEKQLSLLIKEPESSLLSGILLGGKAGLGEDLADAFTTAGVIHIVVLSGFNMTIVAYALSRASGQFFNARTALLIGGLGIAAFCLMVGLSATVMRAGAMALLALLASAIGRRYDILRALCVVGCIMLAFNPYLLVHDPSFQLSFLASAGLILFGPLIAERLGNVPERGGLREIAAATIATQLAVLPLLLWMTGELSFVALPANMLILPLIPLTMLIGFLAGAFSFVSFALGLPFAWAAQFLLSYEIAVAETLSRLPLASVTFPPFSIWVVAILYGAPFCIAWFLRYKKSQLGLRSTVDGRLPSA